ncbi:hypothetical protein NPIL_435511, partial [Nephila pilipes]
MKDPAANETDVLQPNCSQNKRDENMLWEIKAFLRKNATPSCCLPTSPCMWAVLPHRG